MRTYLTILLPIYFGMLLLFTGCEKNVYEKPIDSDIRVALEEQNGSVYLFAETTKFYGLTGYSIKYAVWKLGAQITVKFNYIRDIESGPAAPAPAICYINLGKLGNEEYTIKFKLNGETTEGKILKDPLRLEIPEPKNVKLK